MSCIVTFGEIMARLAMPGYQRFQQALPGSIEVTFAGAEASVAAAIALLGGQSRFVTALPDHKIADACLMNLRGLGVDTQQIVRTPEGRLGIYYYERGANDRAGTVIYDREDSAVAITPSSAYDWSAIFADAQWFVISGITPAISRLAAEVTLTAIRAAHERGIPIACDMNYRSKLWRWSPSLAPRELASQTMRSLLPYVSLFIGAKEDAEAMTGMVVGSDDLHTLTSLAQGLKLAFPQLHAIAFTRRQNHGASESMLGGFLYDALQDATYCAPLDQGEPSYYTIRTMVDRLGAGDAFTAGLVYALTTAGLNDPQVAIQFAAAAGALAHSIEGDFNFVTRSEIEGVMGGVPAGRICR